MSWNGLKNVSYLFAVVCGVFGIQAQRKLFSTSANKILFSFSFIFAHLSAAQQF
jgi:hypothetical protein